MLMDIVKSIVISQADFDLAGEIVGTDGLLQAAMDVQADVVVLGGLASAGNDNYHDLLYGRPRIKVIVIAASGREAVLHELQPQLIPLGDVAPASLIAAIRGTPHPDAAPSIARQ
jgi:hypothetical protein